jgi:hypothetical protein
MDSDRICSEYIYIVAAIFEEWMGLGLGMMTKWTKRLEEKVEDDSFIRIYQIRYKSMNRVDLWS